MPVEVVVEEVVELLAGDNVAATVHHGAPCKLLVEVGVITTIELVHHHLPHGVRSAIQSQLHTVLLLTLS